jgi:hypothetical protein
MDNFEILDVHFTFKRRPLDLPGDLRPNWRVPLLVIILVLCCRGGRSSLFRLHLLNWTIREKGRQTALIASLSSSTDYSGIRLQVEPSFVKAIQFAVGEGLLERLGKGRVKITDKGKQFGTDIMQSDCLFEEKTFLNAVGFRLTEEWVTGFAMWSKAA